ncbi:MAG TPA: C45 family peptidase [Bryobacteraceae bacterium]|nr:C45 family peptidase [Bryobacteraceae bacterium]
METAFPLVSVSGTAFQMGYQHGKQAASLIRRYLAWIEKLAGQPRAALCANALRFLPLIEKLSKPYADEIMGLAEGAQISVGEAVLCQTRAEAAHRFEGACTAFALTGSATRDGHPLAGQNQDLEPEYAEVAIVLHVHPSDGRPRAVMLTFAGQLGYAGMNQHGVAHFANALYHFTWRPGLPHYPLKRVLLEQPGVPECVELLRRHRTCSAANVVLCDGRGRIADVEVRPEGIALYNDDHPDRRLHSNHYVSREFAPFEDGHLPDSCPRLDRIRALVRDNWGRLSVDRMKEILADHAGDPAAICRHGASGMLSICGYIAEPAKGRFHIRRGLGCQGHWETYIV